MIISNMGTEIIECKLIGPFELPRRVNAEGYLHFLQNDLDGLLDDMSLETRRDMWLQHDGAPTHYALVVRRYLNSQCRNGWIGRGGTIQWPPRSPGLNPLDLFLWGYFKELVYEKENQTDEELRQKISEATNVINNNEQSFRNFIRRCPLCVRTRRRNFEHFL